MAARPRPRQFGSDAMDGVLEDLNKTNLRLDSVDRRRVVARQRSCRGVPGLPKSEDFQLPKYVAVDMHRVNELVAESRSCKKGLRCDPGGRAFMPNQYLKPKILNSWQQSRAIMPPRSYKTFRGQKEPDLRELYRWRAQPDEIAPPDPSKMGEQHIHWMIGHRKQRDRHLYPIAYHQVAKRQYIKRREKIIADAEKKIDEADEDQVITDVQGDIVYASQENIQSAADALGEGKKHKKRVNGVISSRALSRTTDLAMLQRSMSLPTLGTTPLMATHQQNGTSITGMIPEVPEAEEKENVDINVKKASSKQITKSGYDAETTAKLRKLIRPESPDLGKAPIDINPKLFKYINRNTRLFGISLPHELPLEERCAEKEYLPKVIAKNEMIEARKAEEARIEALKMKTSKVE